MNIFFPAIKAFELRWLFFSIYKLNVYPRCQIHASNHAPSCGGKMREARVEIYFGVEDLFYLGETISDLGNLISNFGERVSDFGDEVSGLMFSIFKF